MGVARYCAGDGQVLIVGALVVLAALAFCWRPATILGVDGDALAHSIGGGDFLNASRCKDRGDGPWRCSIDDPKNSSAVGYVVQTHSFGCWDATRQDRQPPGGHFPKRPSGCINLIDVISPV